MNRSVKMPRRSPWALLAVLTLGLCLLVPSTVIAQDQGSQDQQSDDTADETFLDTVTVTATKREESIQEVPIAVTAVTETQIERAGLKDIRDLPLLATSFNMNSSQTESQGSTLRIRGVGTTGNNIGLESAVGVFLDGVYLSRPGVALGDQLDVEAIEVLRGPQGTLFGRNVSAGALNVRTKAPSLSGTDGFANITAGNFNALNLQAGITGPASDTFGYRVSGAVRQQDGTLRSATGAETRDRDRFLLRGQGLWEFGDRSTLRVIGDYSDADEKCCDSATLSQGGAFAVGAYERAGLPANGGVVFVGFEDSVEARRSNSEEWSNPFDQTGFSAELNLGIGDNTTLTYIGAWRDFRAESIQQDFVGIDAYSVGPQAAAGFESFDEIESMTHELRLDGDTDRFSWMVGGYLSDEEIIEQGALGLEGEYTQFVDSQLWFFAFGPVLGAAPLLADVPLATGGTFGDVLAADSPARAFAGGLDSAGSYAQNLYEQDGESWSLFTHNTWRVTDRFSLFAGLRYVDETKDGSFRQVGANNPACLATLANAAALGAGAAGTGLEVVAGTITGFSAVYMCFPFAAPALGVSILPSEFDDTFDDDELVYTGKAVVEFSDRVSGYASYTHGFKSGGFNLDSTAAAGGADPRFRSELIDSIEVGVKSEFANRRVRMNLAVFDYDIEDFQVLEFTGTQFVTFNVPNAQSSGVELELSALATNSLELSFGFTHAESEYPDDCAGTLTISNVTNLCGAPFTNAPENVATGGFGYNTTIADRFIFFFSGNARWEDDRRTSTQPGLDFDVQESNTKAHLRLGLGGYSGNWTVELWGDNITDEQTRNVTFNTPLRVGSRSTFLEAPRTYGATLRLRM